MESIDPQTLLDRVALGEASEDEILRLSEMMDRDPALAKQLKEELEFAEWMRLAVRGEPGQETENLRESIGHQVLSMDDWVGLARDGDMSTSAADELARHLLDFPECAESLRSDLYEDENIAQIVSPAKSEDAFVDSLVTRMWAETTDDHFVKDLSKKLKQIDREEPSNVVAFPSRSWKAKVATVAGMAAAVAIGAFFVTTHMESDFFSAAVAKIGKATEDVIWGEGSKPGSDGSFKKGTYKLEAGAVSLEMAEGKSLAVQGPAVFEVDSDGQAVLHEGIALATSSPSDQKIGIGLSAKNVSFSDGAITVGIDARSTDSTEAIVFSGEAGVCLTEAKKCRDVFEFEAIKADHTKEKFIDVPYNPRAFSKAWELVSGIEKNMGDIVIELPGIASSSRPGGSGEIRVFMERDRFTPETPMEVDVIRPGFFATSEDNLEGRSLDSSEEMRSYLVQLWPANSGVDDEAVEASMTFDHKVVGVIFSSERLWESDKMVGASTQHLAESGNRGLDSLGDQIQLSEDGRTLNLKLKGNQSEIDQVRVLVALK